MASCVIIDPALEMISCWIDLYANAFKSLGYDVGIVSSIENIYVELPGLLNNDCRFIMIFAGRGAHAPMANGLFELLNVPLISLCIDHAEHYYFEFPLMPKNSFTGLFDRGDIDYAKKYISSDNNYFFLTDAGILLTDERPPSFEERDIDILFCGSIPDIEKIRSNYQSYGSQDITRLIEHIIEIRIADERISAREAFEYVMQELHFNPYHMSRTLYNTHAVFSTVSAYVRGFRREKLLRSLMDAGLKIHCVGNIENFKRFNYPNITVSGSVSGPGYPALLRHAKISINTSPLPQYALSERIPTSMLNGALAVTDMNPYMERFFVDERNVIAYKHNDYSTLPERINEVLNNRSKWEDMTNNAYNAASEGHTFTHRAKEILEVLNAWI